MINAVAVRDARGSGPVTMTDSERDRLKMFFTGYLDQIQRDIADVAAAAAKAAKKAKAKPVAKEALDEVHDMPAETRQSRAELGRREYGGLNFRRIGRRPRT